MLEEIFEKYMPEVMKDFSDNLGDRSEYVGASDIVGCERKVVLSKINGVEFNTANQIVLSRGHVAEDIVSKVLAKAGFNYETQYEVIHPKFSFIKAHIDFLFFDKGTKGVLEMKTTTGIPDEPYPSWVQQLQMQIGLLKLNFPKDKIKGALLVMDLSNGQMKVFNGFTPDGELFEVLVDKAKSIYEKVLNKQTEGLETEISPLCSFCPFKKDCPEFSGDEQNVSDDVKQLAKDYKKLSKQEKEAKQKKEAIKDKIIRIVGERTLKFEGYKIIVKNTTKRDVNVGKLKDEFPDVYQSVLDENPIVFFRVF